MRAYRNRKGLKVEVTKEHLDIAVKIKKELQKQSPSHKTSWHLHKKMMEKEGFKDSDRNESYRQMVKSYQKSIGELPTREEYESSVADSKLDSIKQAVGEMSYKKREVQQENRKLNKLKRELSLYGIVTDEINNLFQNMDLNIESKKLDLEKDDYKNKMLVPFSDWHIGLKTPSFNYEIAKKQIEKYVKSIINHCKRFDIKEIYLAGLGDLVENVYMRTTQSYDVEFSFSEQIVKSTEIVLDMIIMLEKEVHVNYLGIVMGNHDRMFIKGQTLENDSAMRIVDHSVESFLKYQNLKNVSILKEDFDGTSIKLDMGGYSFKMVHGDNEKKNNKNKINNHISLDNKFYDCLVFGHYHSFSISEENHGRLSVNVGCLQGSTDYSKKLGYDTIPSQSLIITTEDGILPIRVGLDVQR